MRLLWAFFGNDDDGMYGDTSFNPNQIKSFWWAIKWWVRNPMHNLTHYVLGFKGHSYGYSGFDTDKPGVGFGWTYKDNGTKWPLLTLNIWNRLGYIGWRPSGAFGLKCRTRPHG